MAQPVRVALITNDMVEVQKDESTPSKLCAPPYCTWSSYWISHKNWVFTIATVGPIEDDPDISLRKKGVHIPGHELWGLTKQILTIQILGTLWALIPFIINCFGPSIDPGITTQEKRSGGPSEMGILGGPQYTRTQISVWQPGYFQAPLQINSTYADPDRLIPQIINCLDPSQRKKKSKSGGPSETALRAHWAWVCTDPLSFHCREWEVIAALWSQPGAMPSRLRAKKPRPSPKPHGPLPDLERASQHCSPWPNPAGRVSSSTPPYSPRSSYKLTLLSSAMLIPGASAYREFGNHVL